MFGFLRSIFGSKGESAGAAISIDALQGGWRMVSLAKDGRVAPAAMIAGANIVMTIVGNRYRVFAGGEESEAGAIVLDTSKSPVQFDQHIEVGDDAGQKHLGIVRLSGGKLENCQGDVGRPRPTDFALKRTDGASLVTFQRVR